MGIIESNIETSCPECGRRVRFRLRDAGSGRTVRCPAGHRIHLRDEGHTVRKLANAERDLKRTIDKINRQLRRRR